MVTALRSTGVMSSVPKPVTNTLSPAGLTATDSGISLPPPGVAYTADQARAPDAPS